MSPEAIHTKLTSELKQFPDDEADYAIQHLNQYVLQSAYSSASSRLFDENCCHANVTQNRVSGKLT